MISIVAQNRGNIYIKPDFFSSFRFQGLHSEHSDLMQVRRRTITLVMIAFAACCLISCGATSPSPGIGKTYVVPGSATPDSISVIPGPEYEAGWLHRFFFGDHYRDLWTTPTRVFVLDAVGGGLTPVEAGGGFQTKSLRFVGRDGKHYKFRSVDKNPRAILPIELQQTIAGDIAQDHISTSHPAGAMVVDALSKAVDVPRLGSTIVYLPDDERLGEHQESFGGLLGIYEVYPEVVQDTNYGLDFLKAEKIQNTLKMYEGMEEDSEDRPDPFAFLTARFLDILVGDWDRHVKQWKWARFEKEGKNIWYPIPMDRDQAFVKLDGLFPSFAEMSISQFVHFSDASPDIYKLTFSGQYLDRRLLAGVEKRAWDSVASVFTSKLTDEVIERAVQQLPSEYYSRDGKRLEHDLKSRRNTFKLASDAFYALLSDYVDVHLSEKQEYAEIRRLDNHHVELTAWKRERSTGLPKLDHPVFHRVFDGNETKEIRLYMHGGDDKVVVSGRVGSSILVRVIGGKGDDEMIDDSFVEGQLWGFVPFIPSARHLTFFYDQSGDNTFKPGGGCSVEERDYSSPPGGIFQY